MSVVQTQTVNLFLHRWQNRMCFIILLLLLYETTPVQVNVCRYSIDTSSLFGPHCLRSLFVFHQWNMTLYLFFNGASNRSHGIETSVQTSAWKFRPRVCRQTFSQSERRSLRLWRVEEARKSTKIRVGPTDQNFHQETAFVSPVKPKVSVVKVVMATTRNCTLTSSFDAETTRFITLTTCHWAYSRRPFCSDVTLRGGTLWLCR